MIASNLKRIWGQTNVLMPKYHKAFNDYWLTQDEDCANKLNEIRLLINNNFEEALCIVGIKFTGIDWMLFESRVKDINAISVLGYHVADLAERDVSHDYEKDIELLLEEYIECICELMIDGS